MSIELGDQQIVHFLEDQEGLFRGEAWPSHVVLSPWFNVPFSRRDELGDELRIIARRWKPFGVDIGDGELSGHRRHPSLVTTIGGEGLRAFAYNLTNVVARVGGVVRGNEFASGSYRPHIIHRPGDTISLDSKQLKIASFSLVETIDNPAANREIAATYRLEGIK